VWFTEPSDPSTIAVLLVEVALLGLALAAALGVLVRPVRWLARCLAAFSVLVALLGFGEVVWELWTFRYPLILPEAAFGTYAQPTVAGLAPLLLVSVTVAVAGVLVAGSSRIALHCVRNDLRTQRSCAGCGLSVGHLARGAGSVRPAAS
jgi:hypothetical protein